MEYGTYEFHGGQHHLISELARVYDGSKRVALIYSHGKYDEKDTFFELFARKDEAQSRLNQLALAAIDDKSLVFYGLVELGTVHKIAPVEIVKSWKIEP